MATIKINNLNAAGSDLFNDSESYLNELTNEEVTSINGGIVPLIVSAYWASCATVGILYGISAVLRRR
ncbi:class IIb bacteriocin, lactobin A/cerein 7B family [Nostoc sp. C052]|uniref:class IIb bacteriocin, lactobin A/cerein 7B family n=1 Tax=Nostoc sp. C052 TaxID=2576902 RepID=UPI0015C3BA2C|nr:class IIb bacteriocin, lactobin A/cerein 7B family [Nostoc sp. C052]QLE39980.1 class IIb bacteriocin, lactobin A/cerein 7B family [Nostoc sp. C052]